MMEGVNLFFGILAFLLIAMIVIVIGICVFFAFLALITNFLPGVDFQIAIYISIAITILIGVSFVIQ